MNEWRNHPRRRKVWIALPAFNEEQDLPRLLERIDDAMAEADLSFELLVVDDGSTDSTFYVAEQWANELPLQVRRHEQNQGLGATLSDGVHWASELAHPSDVIITLDADTPTLRS